MKRRLGILMLGGAKRVSIGRMIISAGMRLGFDVELFSYELETHVPVASIAQVIIGRRWNDPEIYSDLRSVTDRYGIDIMIPFVDGAVGIVSGFCSRNTDVWAPVSDETDCYRMFDKVEADRFFRQCGLPLPAVFEPDNISFPAIAKPRRGSASKGILIVKNGQDTRELCHDAGNYIIQEYIENREEYSVDCYIGRDGRILAMVPRRRTEITGGEVSRSVTVDDPRLTALSTEIIIRTGLTGAVTLQFLRDIDRDRILLMEINPRLGGGVVCAVHAGADIPAMMIREWAGLENIPAKWRPGVEIVRYFQEVVFENE